eukprot:TRINITY_DN6248_c0_g4_i1.p1 TRINITY_DN6248_c0_g4~~TRINITY_DN6248_c0_g4_i1.p1  ORF type:complete len:593 (-),score=69.37 TRINITY_DN6248_c0_g4_i1:77-1855(-)
MTPSLFAFFLLLLHALTAETTEDADSSLPRFLGRLPRLSRASSLRGTVIAETPNVAAFSETEMMEQNKTLAKIAELEGAAFAFGIEKQLNDIRGALLPVFVASPKNEYGRLDDAPARYALRRVLNGVYGWDVPELGEEDDQDDPANLTPKLAIGHSLSSAMRRVLEERTVETGSGLLELSLFVAALQQATVDDRHKRLVHTYRLMRLDVEMRLDREMLHSVVDLYMGAFIGSEDLSQMRVTERAKFQADVEASYIVWTEAQRFFRDVERSVMPDLSNFTFGNVAEILQRIQTDLPFWNNRQCLGLKQSLMSMELQSSGRVRLLDFYEGALHKGTAQFAETKTYLKSLGALDESDPLDPRVIISNYLDGPSNCISETRDYSLCCIDECGGLFDHIERHLMRAQATPEELIAIVQHLSSSTMQRGRLSNAILRRIHDIAAHHNGIVLLHGQLFAEWMHYAYPRECTHPQMFGDAHAQPRRQWKAAAGRSIELSEDELRLEVAELQATEIRRMSRANSSDDLDQSETCWTWAAAEMNVTFADEEEAVIPHLWAVTRDAWRCMCMAAVLFFISLQHGKKLKHLSTTSSSKGHARFP